MTANGMDRLLPHSGLAWLASTAIRRSGDETKHGDHGRALAVIGVDIGKEVFHLVGFGTDGKIAFRKKIRRLDLKGAFEQLPPCIVGMEACLSAHFVSRTLRALGHEPRISRRSTSNRS